MFRLLKVIFVILFLITIGEVGYYIYIWRGKDTSQSVANSSVNPPITSLVTQEIIEQPWCKDASPTNQIDKSFMSKAAEIVKVEKKKLIKKAYITVVYRGKVNTLQLDSSIKARVGNIDDFVLFQIVNPDNGQKDYAISSPRDELKNSTFRIKKPSEDTFIVVALDDLSKYIKLGDLIEAEVMMELGDISPKVYNFSILSRKE